MKRRTFLNTSRSIGALSIVPYGCSKTRTESRMVIDSGKLAGKTLEELRDQFRHDLFERYLPFFSKYMVDNEYGGFFPYTEFDGTNRSAEGQSSWWLGRGIWMVSFLYKNILKDDRFLDTGQKAVDIILRNKPDANAMWPSTFDREGNPTGKPTILYNDLFVTEGLALFGEVTGNDTIRNCAKETLLKCMRIYDSSDYDYAVNYGPKPLPVKAPRIIGHWMVFLLISTQMLRYKPDPDIELIAERCVDAIMNFHMNPEFGLLNEVINHDLSRHEGPFAQFCYTGHSYETLWMVMWEAVRKKDNILFNNAADSFKRHVEVSWDDVYGGVFHSLDNVNKNIWKLSKQTWAQVEVMVGCMLLLEYRGDSWARDMFEKMYHYFQEKYSLTQLGCPIWLLGGDRKLDPFKRPGTGDIYHIPRWLMFNLLSLNRMIYRKGKVSDTFG